MYQLLARHAHGLQQKAPPPLHVLFLPMSTNFFVRLVSVSKAPGRKAYLRTEFVHTVCFAGGKPEFYIGSADWMTRNLMRRVEVVTPVIDEGIKKELQVRTRGKLVLVQQADLLMTWNRGLGRSIASSLAFQGYPRFTCTRFGAG